MMFYFNTIRLYVLVTYLRITTYSCYVTQSRVTMSRFRKTLFLNRNCDQNPRNHSFDKLNKWLATILAFATFLLLLGYVIYNTYTASDTSTDETDTLTTTSSSRTRDLAKPCSFDNDTFITCYSIDSTDDLINDINEAASKVSQI